MSSPDNLPARPYSFFHAPSGRRYTVTGSSLRRTLADGSSPIEKSIDFVIGSGAHSRSLVHRRSDGMHLELPVSWYAEQGGSWAMSPGYDRPDHSDFRRPIADSCLFCHSAYPRGAAPQAIDCQRCHGPGEDHAQKRGRIVNPAKLSFDRRLEVCLQCHLETAGRSAPEAIRHYGRGSFSYRPGEPLGDFMVYFESNQEAFTVNSAGRGMLRSKCFQASGEKLSCTTCHDPHGIESRSAAAACKGCHAEAHHPSSGCVSCHMPKRRTDDAVHVVMTDHWIRSKPPAGDLLAPKAESHGRYAGSVQLARPVGRDAQIYLAVAAAAVDPSTAPRLETLLRSANPEEAQFYFELATAYRRLGRRSDAIRWYERAAHDPRSVIVLSELYEPAKAIPMLQAAPQTPDVLNAIANAFARISRFEDALKALDRALKLDPESPTTHLNLGVCYQALGETSRARAAYREALRLQPDLERARRYLNQ